MASVAANRRQGEERVPVALPVILDRGMGITRNVSASGLYFESEVSYAPGSKFSFAIELDDPERKVMLKCQGLIVRVEDCGGKVGVAAKIIESRLEMVKDSGRLP